MTQRSRETGSQPDRCGAPPQRWHHSHGEWVAERLSDRDWHIIETINCLRLASGQQLQRLHFATLSGRAREVVRGRVLRRLVHWHILTMLPRRVGGASRGSAGTVFALGSAGAPLLAERLAATTSQPRVRHPGALTERTVRHTLAISELYTDLVEHARVLGAHVVAFDAEPACWWPNGLGGFLKPDAYTLLMSGDVREHWWIEAELATESLPTVQRKLTTYLAFVARGQRGPAGVIPRVLVSAVSQARADALAALVNRLPTPASQLFVVHQASESPRYLLQSVRE